MFKLTIISTIFAAAAFQVSAEPINKHDLSILPADVALRVAELQKHGARFEPVIRAIVAEATKPTWNFDDCGHESLGVTVAANQS